MIKIGTYVREINIVEYTYALKHNFWNVPKSKNLFNSLAVSKVVGCKYSGCFILLINKNK